MIKQILYNKKYSGILWAIIVGGIFTGISLGMRQVLSGNSWYLFNSILRLLFGFIILFVAKKIYGRTVKDVLSINGSKTALIAGSAFLFYFVYYVIAVCLGIKSITGLTIGLLISRLILQQISTGFYEELNYRVLILEGYFYGTQNIKNKLLYAFLSFVFFGAVHIVNGWDTYVDARI